MFPYSFGIFIRQTSLVEQDFLVLHYCASLADLPMLSPNPGWLALSPPVLIEGKLRIYPRYSGVELARLPFLVFRLIEAQ